MELPPLRDRKEDVADLSSFFIKKYSEINKKPVKPLSDEALKTLQSYEWPGNVRELEHTIERAVVLSKTAEITSKDLFLHGITIADFKSSPKEEIKDIVKEDREEKDVKEVKNNAEESKVDNAVGRTIADVEQELILKTLQDVAGNRTKAAEILGITVRTLRNKLNEYRDAGIDVEEYLK